MPNRLEIESDDIIRLHIFFEMEPDLRREVRAAIMYALSLRDKALTDLSSEIIRHGEALDLLESLSNS
jgi:hypothetical protein